MITSSEIAPAPHAVMSEKYILSCMFVEPSKFIPRSASDGIDLEAFHLPAHREMLEALRSDFRNTGSLDLTVFVQQRDIDGTLARLGGPSAVYDIYSYQVDDGGRWTDHTGILREMKARRCALNGSRTLSEALASDEAIYEAKRTLDALQAAVAGPRRASTSKDAVDEFSNKLQADHAAGEMPGKSSGIDALDKICGGMKPGEFWVIGGRPSDGKSVILLQIGSAFIRRGDPVAIFSLEMMKHEIVGRLVSCMGRVDFSSIVQPRNLNKGDLQRIQTTASAIAAAPLWIDASAGQSLETITAEAQRIRDSHGGLALIIVDYIQLMRGGRSRNETREEEVARVSGGLKQLAKAIGCPVLSATQLNDDGRVRESRAITHDADGVLVIAADGVKVLKMRNAVRGATLPLQLDGRFQRFTERQP